MKHWLHGFAFFKNDSRFDWSFSSREDFNENEIPTQLMVGDIVTLEDPTWSENESKFVGKEFEYKVVGISFEMMDRMGANGNFEIHVDVEKV